MKQLIAAQGSLNTLIEPWFRYFWSKSQFICLILTIGVVASETLFEAQSPKYWLVLVLHILLFETKKQILGGMDEELT